MRLTESVLTQTYPNLATWIKEGSVEITTEFGREIVARAFDEGGVIWEGDHYHSFDEAIEALDTGIEYWLKTNF
jgi:hypothetical protein